MTMIKKNISIFHITNKSKKRTQSTFYVEYNIKLIHVTWRLYDSYLECGRCMCIIYHFKCIWSRCFVVFSWVISDRFHLYSYGSEWKSRTIDRIDEKNIEDIYEQIRCDIHRSEHDLIHFNVIGKTIQCHNNKQLFSKQQMEMNTKLHNLVVVNMQKIQQNLLLSMN